MKIVSDPLDLLCIIFIFIAICKTLPSSLAYCSVQHSIGDQTFLGMEVFVVGCSYHCIWNRQNKTSCNCKSFISAAPYPLVSVIYQETKQNFVYNYKKIHVISTYTQWPVPTSNNTIINFLELATVIIPVMHSYWLSCYRAYNLSYSTKTLLLCHYLTSIHDVKDCKLKLQNRLFPFWSFIINISYDKVASKKLNSNRIVYRITYQHSQRFQTLPKRSLCLYQT